MLWKSYHTHIFNRILTLANLCFILKCMIETVTIASSHSPSPTTFLPSKRDRNPLMGLRKATQDFEPLPIRQQSSITIIVRRRLNRPFAVKANRHYEPLRLITAQTAETPIHTPRKNPETDSNPKSSQFQSAKYIQQSLEPKDPSMINNSSVPRRRGIIHRRALEPQQFCLVNFSSLRR